jgi:hypothetical protein
MEALPRNRPRENASLVFDVLPKVACADVVIYEAYGLHERIYGSRTDEGPPSSFEVFAHPCCFRARPHLHERGPIQLVGPRPYIGLIRPHVTS